MADQLPTEPAPDTSAPPVAPDATETVHVSLKGPYTGHPYELDVPSFDSNDPTHLDQIKSRVLELDKQESLSSNKLLKEQKRSFWANQDAVANRPGAGAEAAGLGIADTALAGTPEALARESGVPQEQIDAVKVASPWMTAGGEILGAASPLGELKSGMKIAKGAWNAIKTGARIGGIYGLGSGVSKSIPANGVAENPENPTGQIVDTATQGAKGAGEGALVGGLVGGLGNLAGGYAKNVFELGEQAKKQIYQALKGGNKGEGDPAKYMTDVNHAIDLLQPANKEQPIKTLEQLNQVNQTELDQRAGSIEQQLTSAGKKGIMVPGEELRTDYVKNALFPQSFQKQLDSTEQQNLNNGINALLDLKGRTFSGKQLDPLAASLLNHEKWSSIPEETRTDLVKKINSVDRETGSISGDQLMAEGLRGLQPSESIPGHDPGLNLQEPQIQSVVAQTDKFGAGTHTWTPWEIEDRIQKINDEIAIVERKVPDAAKTSKLSEPDVASLKNEQNLLRTKLDEVMSSGPNGEFRQEKTDLGALMRLRRVAQGAQLAEYEGKGTRATSGFEGARERAIRNPHNSLGAALALVKTDRDLSPSERIAKGFELWAKSKAQPNRLGNMVGQGNSMKILEGLSRSPERKLINDLINRPQPDQSPILAVGQQ